MTEQLRDMLRVRIVDGSVDLAGYDTSATPGVDGKQAARDDREKLAAEFHDLHEMMMAQNDRALLLVLQGVDASGKNGTIKHVVPAANPAGVRVASFVEPTAEERSHHFLWRIRRELPGPGTLGVFNRSQYEDALVPMATSDDVALDELDEMVTFEKELAAAGVLVVKVFPHISYDEQRRRFVRRLRRDDKRWKFSESDIDTRRLWSEYQAAYGQMMAHTDADRAPWYVVPADHKWYRNWAVARLLVETLSDMNLTYPQPNLDGEALRARLQPPH